MSDESASEDTSESPPVETVEAVETINAEGAPAAIVEEIIERAGDKPAKKPRAAAKKVKPETQALDALVTTITSMAESVATLSNTVDSLSDKIVTPPAFEAAVISEAEHIPAVVEEVETSKEVTLRGAAIQSVGKLASYVGVGLVAAAVMRSTADVTTSAMAVIGIVLYLAYGLLIENNESAETLVDRIASAGMVLLAVVGIGVLVGGIQRFGDQPRRAAALIPVGAAIFLVVSAWNLRKRLAVEHLVWMAGSGVWVCLFLALGLGQVAHSMDPKPAKTDHGVTVHAPNTGAAEESTTTTTAGMEHATEETSTTVAGHGGESMPPPEAPASEHSSAIDEAVTAAENASH